MGCSAFDVSDMHFSFRGTSCTILDLLSIDCLSPLQMLNEADAIDWNGRKLEGVISVLESLETPLLDQPLSATLLELRQLLESVRKVLQVRITI